jgi:hypothetical protein
MPTELRDHMLAAFAHKAGLGQDSGKYTGPGSGANLKGSASGGNGLDDGTGLRTGTLHGSEFRPRDNCPVRAVVPDIQAQLP